MKRGDRLGLLVVASALGLAAATFFIILEDIRTGRLADEIHVSLDGGDGRVSISCLDGRQSIYGLEERDNRRSWTLYREWASKLYLSADSDALSHLRSVSLRIGSRAKVWRGDQLQNEWKRVHTPPLYESERRQVLTYEFPDFSLKAGFLNAAFVNWPGAWSAIQSKIRVPLICVITAWMAAWVVWLGRKRPWFQNLSERVVPAPGIPAAVLQEETRKRADLERCWFAVGLAFLMIAVAWLEWNQHLYFTQDDNFSQFLPVILQGCAAVFQGHLPLWNPFQLFGAATLTVGTYALTYPLTYVSYAIARFIFGHEQYTLEVFAIAHLAAGYCATYWLLRRLGVRAALASAGAICFVLSGFFLIAGRGWYYMFPVAVWVPLLVGLTLKLMEGEFSWKITLTAGAILGLFFHAGNAQMWIYTVIFLMLLALARVVGGLIAWKQAARLIPALLLGAGLAAPLLLWQASETSNLERFGGQGPAIQSGLAHVFLPLGPLIQSPIWSGIECQYVNEVYYSGTLFVFATALGLAFLFSRARMPWKGRAALAANNIWLVFALVSLLYALGPAGVVWSVTAMLPVFNQFNVPLKFMAFFALFSVLGGALVCERLLGSRPRVLNGLATGALMLMALHVALSRASFYSFGDREYLGPPAPMRELVSPPTQRILPLAAHRTIQAGYTASLTMNFSTAASLMSARGYDPLIEQGAAYTRARKWIETNPRAAAQALGISWVLLHDSIVNPPEDGGLEKRPLLNGTHQQIYQALREESDQTIRNASLTLMHLPGSAPLAFASSSPGRPLPVQWSTEGARVDVSSLSGIDSVTLNVLWRKWMHFFQDGVEVASRPDEYGRAVAVANARGEVLEMRYLPPVRQALMASAVLFLLALGSAALLAGTWKFRTVSRSLGAPVTAD